MSGPLGMASQFAVQAARSGLYFSIAQLSQRVTARMGLPSVSVKPSKPVPGLRPLLEDAAGLLLRDARNVGEGLYAPDLVPAPSAVVQASRLMELMRDLPAAAQRRARGDTREAAVEEAARGKPDYYRQNFHYQSGGYLTEQSARLYDMQVELLFFGVADAMRRTALPHVARHMRGRDQRGLALLDAACGTGRFVRQVLRNYPRLNVTGIDLSGAYLEEARRHIGPRKTVRLIEANAEAMPLGDASQDMVVSQFLFHELPGAARRNVAAEFARVLKPGGLLVVIDSLQWGDEPGYDGLLEVFPARFHEPYYEEYLGDDLGALFTGAGLEMAPGERAFLSKVVVVRKP
ncbi:MAG: class I SAM-dependent methyltransferase [Hyphomicrobiales bacterium]